MVEPRGPWRVIIERQANNDLAQLPQDMIPRAVAAIDRLTGDARPPGCVKVVGVAGSYRLRVGDYRIVYEVDDAIGTVYIVRVRHRREVYRRR